MRNISLFSKANMQGLHIVLFVIGLASFDCSYAEEELVDLSHPFSNQGTACWPAASTKFNYKYDIYGPKKDGNWYSIGEFKTSDHCGTHLDAPIHAAAGKWHVNEIPLHHLVAPGSIIDVSSKSAGDPDYQLSVQDVVDWEEEHGSIDGTIVFIYFGWETHYHNNLTYYFIGPKGSLGPHGNDTSNLHYPGIHRDTAEWMVRQRPSVLGVGLDTPSLDNGQSKDLFSHRIFFTNNIYGLENVRNLAKLPARVDEIVVLPMTIEGATGAPVRIIARIKENDSYMTYLIIIMGFIIVAIACYVAYGYNETYQRRNNFKNI